MGAGLFYHVRHGFDFMQEFCPMVWDIRYRSLDKMISIGIINYEFRSCIFSSIWLNLILGQKLNAKKMLGCCLIFCSNHFSAAAGTATKLADEVMGRTGVSKN